MQKAAQEIQASTIPRRDSETPEVINSNGGAEGLHDIQAPDTVFHSSVFC